MSNPLASVPHAAAGMSRRRFLAASRAGLVGLGGAGLLGAADALAASPGPRSPRAKSVIVLYLYGAPSQMDTLDPKPNCAG